MSGTALRPALHNLGRAVLTSPFFCISTRVLDVPGVAWECALLHENGPAATPPSKIASDGGTKKVQAAPGGSTPQVSRQIRRRRRFQPFSLVHRWRRRQWHRSAQEKMDPQRPTHRVTPEIVCFSSFCRLLVQQCHYCSLAGRGVPRGPVAGLLEEC